MGCFLACFGSSQENEKQKKQRRKVRPRDQRNPTSSKPRASSFSSVHTVPDKPITPVLEPGTDNKPEGDEQLNLSTRKKVTFDSNVKTYDPVIISHEEADPLLVIKPEKDGWKQEEKNSLSKIRPPGSSSSDDSSATSSTGSYPPNPNHRYQNCRDSDDEDEALDYADDDISDDDDDDFSDYDDQDDIKESMRGISSVQVFTEEIDNSKTACGLLEKELNIGSNRNVRDRSTYVHPVLNPVENLSQWKAVKAKTAPSKNPEKGNSIKNSFHSEVSFCFQSKRNQNKKSNNEVAVDASLSNWLVSPKTTPPTKMMSPEERPILGALTVDELKQFSASTCASSPRKSPNRSPDENAIIGTVGSHWQAGSASSLKGIPNTTSKYREDKRVNWHSTPFETRLERALNRGGD